MTEMHIDLAIEYRYSFSVHESLFKQPRRNLRSLTGKQALLSESKQEGEKNKQTNQSTNTNQNINNEKFRRTLSKIGIGWKFGDDIQKEIA